MDPLDRLVSQEWHHPLVQELRQLLSAHYPHNQHAYMIGRAGGLAWQHVDATGPAALTWFSMLSQAPKQRGVRRLLEAVPKDDEAVRRQLEQLVQRMEKAAEAAPPRGRVDVGTAHRRPVAWEAAPAAADNATLAPPSFDREGLETALVDAWCNARKRARNGLAEALAPAGVTKASDFGAKFAAAGMQIAGGVPLQVDEGDDFSTFRLGLFGLDKLHNVDRTVASLDEVLDQVL